jgi:head-tail adaptor
MNSKVRAQPGAFRHRVDYAERPAGDPVSDTFGQEAGAWATLAASLPASVDPLSGRERGEGRSAPAEATHRIRTRVRPDVPFRPRGRFLFGARVLEVLEVRDLEERGRIAEVLCVEALPGG